MAEQLQPTSPGMRTVTAAGDYAITVESGLIIKKASGAATGVTLPKINASSPVMIDVVDGKGDAASNNITISGYGGETINGAATYVISAAYGAVRLVSNGTEWNVLATGINSSSGVVTFTTVNATTVATTALTTSSASIATTSTFTPGASTAAAGSTTSDAGVLPAGTATVYPTTAADDTKGVRVHASDKVTGRKIMIGNGVSNKILKVYPPSGGTINGGSADAAFSGASGKGVIMYCLNSTGNTWLAW